VLATRTVTGLQYVIYFKSGGKNLLAHNVLHTLVSEDGELLMPVLKMLQKHLGNTMKNRAAQNGYQPIPFRRKKDGMIPGFIEGLEYLSFRQSRNFHSIPFIMVQQVLEV
jgi:peptidylprolyl isomerase